MALNTNTYGYVIDPLFSFCDQGGKTIANGYVRVFRAGTSTPVLTYRNFDGAFNAETIELDNSGRALTNVIASKGSLYKVCVYDAEHSQEDPVLTVDKVAVIGASVNATNIVQGMNDVAGSGWIKSVSADDTAEISLDATNVTSEVDTMVKATAAGEDYMMPLVHKTGSGPDKKITLGNIFKFVLNFIHSLTDTAAESDIASGNYFALDGSAGTKKLNSTTLLTKTAQSALAGNVAQEFDPTRDEEHQYLEGDLVVYQGVVYIFLKNHYGAWNSNKVMTFKFERFLQQYFYRNRVSCWSGVSSSEGGKEISDYLSRLVLDLKIDIIDETDFNTFWNGPYDSPNGTLIEKRLCGISWTRNNAVQFWMMRDLQGGYMGSSFGNCALFSATEADTSAVTLYGRVKLHTRTTTWGGVAIKATFVVDWSVFENKTSNLSNNYFANEIISIDHPGLIQVHKFIPTLPADLNTYSSRILRLEENVDCNPIVVTNKNEANNYAVQKAVVDARFTVPDKDYDNFWNTGVTVNGTYYPEKNFSYAYGGAVDTVVVGIYWATPNGSYISGSPGNLVMQFGISDAIHLKGTLYLASKTATVDGVSLKIEVVIDTKYILPLTGTWAGNLFRKELVKIDHAGHIFEHKVKETITPSVLPNFSTLTMGVGGDSITAGNQWSYYASQILGVAHHQNEAVGSSFYACRQVTYDGNTYTTQNYDDPNFAGIASGTIPIDSPEAAQKTANNCARCHIQKFIAKVTAGDYVTPDIFCLAYGTNDNVPTSAEVDASVASATNLTINESLNMAGGLRWVLQTITETYPNCKIFVLLPIQGASASRNRNNLSKIEAIKKVCQVFSVPVIDMFSECGIAGLLENGTGPYLSDGLHPNAAGRKLMGAYAAERIIALYGRHLS